eukprot:35028-Eustigmatos_ZCMA.PRE.1
MRQAKVELAMGLVATGAVVAVSFGAYNDIVATLVSRIGRHGRRECDQFAEVGASRSCGRVPRPDVPPE